MSGLYVQVVCTVLTRNTQFLLQRLTIIVKDKGKKLYITLFSTIRWPNIILGTSHFSAFSTFLVKTLMTLLTSQLMANAPLNGHLYTTPSQILLVFFSQLVHEEL